MTNAKDCSSTLNVVLIAALIAIFLPTILHAQQNSAVSPAPPGVSWGSPPTEADWEPITPEAGKESDSQEHSSAKEQHDEITDRIQQQALLAQQAMAEQAKRTADIMFWQLVVGVAVLIGLAIAIYYARQIAQAVHLDRESSPIDRARGQPQPVQTQRAEGAHINQLGKFKR